MKKTFFASQMINTKEYGCDVSFKLEYYMLTSCVMPSDNDGGGECYGIEIIKRYVDIYGNEVSQKSSVNAITYDKKEIYELLRLFYNGKVTPTSLYEITDDYISGSEQKIKQA